MDRINDIQGVLGKNPRGWGFFSPNLTEPSRKKKPTPWGFFRIFGEIFQLSDCIRLF